MNVFALAERLHVPASTIRGMPASEFNDWIQYFTQSNEPENPLTSGDAMLKAFGL